MVVSYGLKSTLLPESENMANRQWGFPRNLGDPVVSTEMRGRGGAASETSGSTGFDVLGRWKRMTRRPGWYRQPKETKGGETDGRKS